MRRTKLTCNLILFIFPSYLHFVLSTIFISNLSYNRSCFPLKIGSALLLRAHCRIFYNVNGFHRKNIYYDPNNNKASKLLAYYHLKKPTNIVDHFIALSWYEFWHLEQVLARLIVNISNTKFKLAVTKH